jgi:hypothetical protein
MTDRVFITNADYPLTIDIPFTGRFQPPRIVPLVKIKETEDPVSKEPLEFPVRENLDRHIHPPGEGLRGLLPKRSPNIVSEFLSHAEG